MAATLATRAQILVGLCTAIKPWNLSSDVSMCCPTRSAWSCSPIFTWITQYRSLDRLRDLGGVILPGHDPLVLTQAPYA